MFSDADRQRLGDIEALIVERDRLWALWGDTRGGWEQYHTVMEDFDRVRAELGDEVPFLLALVAKLRAQVERDETPY